MPEENNLNNRSFKLSPKEFVPTHYPQIFDQLFLFYGFTTSKGFLLEFSGKLFEDRDLETKHLLGQKFSETVFWQSSAQTAARFENVIENASRGVQSKTILDFRINSDEKLFINLLVQPVLDSQEQIDKIFFCAQDVTNRENEIKYHKERSEQLLFAAENSAIGLWFWNIAEDKIFSTPKCSEIFDIAENKLLSLETVLNVVHPEDHQRVENEILTSQNTGREYNHEYRVIYSDGNIHWLSAHGKTYLDKDGNPLTMMGSVRKVTDKKIASEELAKVYAREKKARDEAVEANRAKDFFLAVVSHELRSPLNAILGWSKILLTKEIDEKTRINALETIEKSARTQAKIIEDLIDSSRVASGKLKLEFRAMNLCDILKNIYNSYKPAAEAKNIEIFYEADCDDIQIFGDGHRLQQAFTNILSNAMKFTPSGGKIEIESITTANFAEISIKDTGQGISKEAFPKIFRQFSQGDEQISGSNSGLGLGLSIAKILVEKHQGTIQAESDGLGKGAQFIIKLPLHFSEEKIYNDSINTIDKNGHPLDNLKILIVEDDEDSREVLELFLEQSGAKVQSAESAQKAMEILKSDNPALFDVIISDLAMPVEDGYSLMKRIRQLPVEKGGEIPSMALSAFASSEDKKKAAEAGFQHYHTKPFEPDEIIEDILKLTQ